MNRKPNPKQETMVKYLVFVQICMDKEKKDEKKDLIF